MTDTSHQESKKNWSVVTACEGHPDHDPGTVYSVSATGLTLVDALELVSDIEHEADEALDCDCEPSEVDGEIVHRCTGYPIVTAFHCLDAEAQRYVPEQTLRLPENPPKLPRFGATFFGLAMRDRALREDGFPAEADAAACRFEAVTGIDFLADDAVDADPKPMPRSGYVYAPGPKISKDDVPAERTVFETLLHLSPADRAELQERARKHGETMATFLEKPKAETPRIQHTNRRDRRADAAKARRRSA